MPPPLAISRFVVVSSRFRCAEPEPQPPLAGWLMILAALLALLASLYDFISSPKTQRTRARSRLVNVLLFACRSKCNQNCAGLNSDSDSSSAPALASTTTTTLTSTSAPTLSLIQTPVPVRPCLRFIPLAICLDCIRFVATIVKISI